MAGGVIIYPKNFQKRISQICKKNDVLFVLDEIATGFGRLGSMIEYQSQNSTPDIVSFGKMLTGGYQTFAATLTTKKINDSFLGEFSQFKHLFHNMQINERIQEIKKIQKKDSNIWIISKEIMNISQSAYAIERNSFGEFVKDAQNFVKSRKINKLNIFKT